MQLLYGYCGITVWLLLWVLRYSCVNNVLVLCEYILNIVLVSRACCVTYDCCVISMWILCDYYVMSVWISYT